MLMVSPWLDLGPANHDQGRNQEFQRNVVYLLTRGVCVFVGEDAPPPTRAGLLWATRRRREAAGKLPAPNDSCRSRWHDLAVRP